MFAEKKLYGEFFAVWFFFLFVTTHTTGLLSLTVFAK